MHLTQEVLVNIQCSGGSSFPKEVRVLKKRNIVVGHWKMTTTNWKQSLKLILLQLHEKLPKNSISIILWSFGIWSKLERWKGSISGCLLSWPEKIKTSFWSVIFSYSMQQQWTISQSDCDVGGKVNCIWQLAMASSVVGPRKSSKTLHKAKLALQKRSWSLFGSLLLVWPTTAFWILGKPLPLRSVLDESESVSWSVMSDSLRPCGQ